MKELQYWTSPLIAAAEWCWERMMLLRARHPNPMLFVRIHIPGQGWQFPWGPTFGHGGQLGNELLRMVKL